MEHRKFGYIRVSNKDQNDGHQLEAIRRMGINLALQNGIHFGRPPVHVSEEFKEVYRKW